MPIKGTLLFAFLSAILSIGFIDSGSYWYLSGFILLIFYIFRKVMPQYAFFCVGVFLFFCFYRINLKPDIQSGYTTDTYQVMEVKESYMIVIKEKVRYMVNIEEPFYKKDEVEIKGTIEEIQNDLDLDVFEFSDYLKNKRVYYQITHPSILLIDRNIPIQQKIVIFFTSKLENESFTFTKMLLFNDKNADKEAMEDLASINAMHLFVVSGFHISFFFTLICFLLKKLGKANEIIAFCICFIYIFLLDFTISSTRAFLCLILNRLFHKQLNSLDCIAISGCLTLLIEPLYIYNYSFIMTYIIAITIGLSHKILQNKNKIISAILMSFICLFALVPIQLKMNYEMNFISFFTNILLNSVVSILFVFCLIGLILSPLNGNIFSSVYRIFLDIIHKITTVSYALIFGDVKGWMFVVYYILFLGILLAIEQENVRKFIGRFSILILAFICLYNRNFFNPSPSITFLNVYQGDCTILIDSNNKGVMMVDTGGLQNYDIASKKIIPYLHCLGIKQIDCLVLTHPDFDHVGAYSSLSQQIPIIHVIEDASVTNVDCGNFHFTNLNVYYDSYEDDNAKSIVLYGNVGNSSVLLTGDAPSEIEKEIIKDNPLLNIDILKVGHHGSKYSSCSEFLNFITPDIAMISCGANNFYGHPHQEVLDRLKEVNSLIYRTDINGTIRIEFDEKTGYKIVTAR